MLESILMKSFTILLFLFLAVPISISANVIISEVAWMGTTNSHTDEWIELYNTETNSISLDGWTLEAIDGSPTILLSGLITGGGFFILERTDDTTLPALTANQIYTGALENTGEELYLKNRGNIIDSVVFEGGWPAGDNDSKETMQMVGSEWITGSPTPRSVSGFNSKPVPEPITPMPQIKPEPEESVILEILEPIIVPEPVVEIIEVENNENREETMEELKKELEKAEAKIVSLESKSKEIVAVQEPEEEITSETQQTALVLGSFEVEKPESFIRKIVLAPARFVSFIWNLIF